ncbi:FecCD family ABC transporter permease [Paenibacillus sinopodophylli]|uniref:FecCD family ABC transporter permease n=1 Tax=Paenibacillus sinopodophylli TaxID=1837342 RepID=UPI00110D06E6|nr:iron ABC transporter permease [Paenibacillus sinopodophylli]
MQVTHPDRGSRKWLGSFAICIVIGLFLLAIISALSISFGAAEMRLATAWNAVFHYNPGMVEHKIVHTIRLPRMLASLIAGCSLAMCGAVMQGTTRNPLADSGLMGISAGSTLSIAICMAFLPGSTYGERMLFAFLGAGVATFMTYYIASLGKRGITPQRLVLAGISISMLFGAFSQYIAIRYNIGQSLVYWTAGSAAGVNWNELLIVFPFFAMGVLAAFALSPSITILSLGEEVASGIGLRPRFVQGAATIIVLLLTGLSVIVIGPVGFVGLIVPHMVRHWVGVDYRYIIPASAVYGALLTVSADLIGRIINKPFETPIGIIFGVVGVPYFLYLVRTQRGKME